MPLTDGQREAIRGAFDDFIDSRIAQVGRFAVSELNQNPLLAAVYGPELMAEFMIHQRFERSTVTSFGFTLQKVARIVAGTESASGTGGADLEVTLGGTRYFVQVKTGPSTANKDIADSISTKLNSARARFGAGAAGALGVCFGTLDAVHPIARKEFESRGIALWVGASFWEIIGGGDPDTLHSVLGIATESATRAAGLRAAFELKAVELAKDIRKRVDEAAEEGGAATPEPGA